MYGPYDYARHTEKSSTRHIARATLIDTDMTAHSMALLYLGAYLGEVLPHTLSVALIDDLEQLLELTTDVLDLAGGAGVEENLLQQVVVLTEQPLGNGHMLLEGGTGRFLLLHDGGKDEGAHEGDGERVGHGLVVFVEGVLEDVEPEALVEVLEEDLAQVVALADDDGVLIAEVAETGKGGAEHGVSTHEAEAALAVELRQLGLDRGNIAQDAVLGQRGHHLLEGLDGVLHRSGIDDQLGTELAYLVERSEAAGVIYEAQALGVDVVHRRLVLKTQQICKEGAHLACSENKYSHKRRMKVRYLFMISICWRTDSSWMASKIFFMNSPLISHCSPCAARFSRISL